VVIAAPDYDMDAPVDSHADADQFADRGSFAPLPGAQAEADELRALLADVTVLSGANATVDELRAVKHPALLHIATHGFFSPIDEAEPTRSVEFLPIGDGMIVTQQTKSAVVNPMFFSGLALSGANRRTPGTSTGIVTAQQLAGLDLRGTQLVVLSACETGLGAVERGLEFTGMRRALSIAGAATQVTSLWRVGDDATRMLMRHFYDLLAAGAGRAEALILAQERVASDARHPEWRHPFYWAAFVLSGAWTPMPGALTRRRGVAMPLGDSIAATRTGTTNV
jgi:CHAT domain-containing protein